MNDFTKEELQELIKYVSHPMWTNSCFLTKKIQSMIDNYCEHTNSNISFNCEDCELIL